MLNFIKGPAGSGKTRYIRELITKEIKSNDENIVLIVPEQATFENEREILSQMGAKRMNSILITNFTRLADYVFNKTGGLLGERLNDIGRNILMNLSLFEVQDNLKIYKNQVDKIEINKLMLMLLTELKKCSITTDDLRYYAKIFVGEELSQKLNETALILEAFEAMVDKNYIDPLDDLTRLCSKLKDIKFFEGYKIYIDEFSSFTNQELELISILMKQAEDVYISVSVEEENNNNGYSLFNGAHKTISRLKRIAEGEGVKVNTEIFLKEQYRFKSKEIEYLSKGIYRVGVKPLKGNIKDIIIYNAANQYDESRFVASKIKQIVYENGYRYKDIAVIARDIDIYSGIIDIIFDEYEIPYFIDVSEKIDSKPIMNTVIIMLEIVVKNYRSDDIFKYLKNGLAGLKADEIAVIENYVLMWRINGGDWLSEFKKHPRGYEEKFKPEDNDRLKNINELRIKIIEPLIVFSEEFKNSKSGMEKARAVYEHLIRLNVSEELKNISKSLEYSGEVALANEEIRLWDILMEVLNQIAISVSDDYIDEKRFLNLMKLAISSAEIASIPQTLDQVQIGVAGRSYISSPRAVFIIGANEGEFPRISEGTGIFTDTQRRRLISSGLELYDHAERVILDERYIVYDSVSSASEKLYISFLSADLQSKAKTASSIVRQSLKIFPSLQILDEYCFEKTDFIWAEKPAYELMAQLWREDNDLSKAIKEYFLKDDNYKLDFKKLKLASEKRSFSFESRETSNKFFGDRISLSASQIEKYHLCKFQYFCRYALNARERKVAQVDALEYGSLMHYIFENIFKENSIEDLKSKSYSNIKLIVEKYLNDYVINKLGGWEDKSARFKFHFERLVKTASNLIIHMIKELSQSEFTPKEFEVNIGSKGKIKPLMLKLLDDTKVIIEGKIDRLDLMNKNGVSYIRIVDYKTGVKDFKLSDILYGINIQMLLYMDAVLKGSRKYNENIIPAGILYMSANQPIVDIKRNESEAKIKDLQKKKLKMNGLILEDETVIRGMEKEAKGIFIPVKMKNGEICKSNSLVSLELFGSLLKKIEKLIIDMAMSLKIGDVKALPKKGEYDACTWCGYRSICCYEDGDEVENIENLKKSEVQEILLKEEVE